MLTLITIAAVTFALGWIAARGNAPSSSRSASTPRQIRRAERRNRADLRTALRRT